WGCTGSTFLSLQEQLRRLYPRLKVLALGARPETTLHTYFPSFLSRATPSCPPAMRKEVRRGAGGSLRIPWAVRRQQVWFSLQLLTSMSQCLSVDPLSFSVWRQLYTKHLSQSSLLLNHLLESWDSGSRKVRQALQETVRSFKVTNEELVAKGPGSQQDVAACDAACKLLLQKLKGRGFPWSRLLLVLLVFAAGFLIHDIRMHGSLQASASAHALRSSGILPAWQHAWHKAAHFSLEGYRYTCAPVALPSVPARPARPQPAFPCRWLERTLPACCSHAAALLQPTLQPLWAEAAELAVHISKQCSTYLSWAGEHLPWLLEWFRSRLPDAVLHVAECMRELLLFLLRSCLLPLLEHVAAALQRAWKHCVDACKRCHARNHSLFGSGEALWDCVREHLSSFTYSSWIYLQNTTLALKNWALAMISGH
ncbi:hypothetical protein CIB84_016512, partial [Bambusicola thoracicus]